MTANFYDPAFYTPREVADLFSVDPKTVTRWAKAGKIPVATRTIGGHRRYDARQIDWIIWVLSQPPRGGRP